MFDRARFLDDLSTFVGFETVVCRNPDAFRRADAWIHGFFDPATIEVDEIDCHGLTTSIIRPKGSSRPNIVGDGHIEVVPAAADMFALERDGERVLGRGVADMKTQCLMMIYVLRDLIEEGDANDFWLILSEDEEVGSEHGVELAVDYLAERDQLPKVVFAPDGGPDFAYVEKEKGIMTFTGDRVGQAAHASRPYLGVNAVDRMLAFYRALQERFPNPRSEDDWTVSLSLTRIEGGETSNQIPASCRAGFDLRLTEDWQVGALRQVLEEVALRHGVTLTFDHADPAAVYPRDAPIARAYLDILRQVSGREPTILRSAGASNGRIYVAKNPDIHVLMSNPRSGGAHSADEWLDTTSLDAYYRLVRQTASLDARRLHA